MTSKENKQREPKYSKIDLKIAAKQRILFRQNREFIIFSFNQSSNTEQTKTTLRQTIKLQILLFDFSNRKL